MTTEASTEKPRKPREHPVIAAADPVRVGSMLLTLVEPHAGHEVAYNRWYERDHFYSGCMIGPWQFAGKRFVATADLKSATRPGSIVCYRGTRPGVIRVALLGARRSSRRLEPLGCRPGARAAQGGPHVRRARSRPHASLPPPLRRRSRRGPCSGRARFGPPLQGVGDNVGRRAGDRARRDRSGRSRTRLREEHLPGVLAGPMPGSSLDGSRCRFRWTSLVWRGQIPRQAGPASLVPGRRAAGMFRRDDRKGTHEHRVRRPWDGRRRVAFHPDGAGNRQVHRPAVGEMTGSTENLRLIESMEARAYRAAGSWRRRCGS